MNAVCLAVFIVELLVRIASYWPRPWEFFRYGWNIFDFVVIAAAFVPGIRQNSTLLRLVRLLRIVRIVRVLPDLRVLLLGVWRSVPPLASIGAVTAMILFVYGMVGWILFADELPDQWGNIGRAMLTLFVMLTLEDFPVYMAEAMDVEPWAWVYFVSFILVAAFIVLNVLIGVVLNSMEEARELERRRALRERYGVDPSLADRSRGARTRRRADRDPAQRARRARAGARRGIRPGLHERLDNWWRTYAVTGSSLPFTAWRQGSTTARASSRRKVSSPMRTPPTGASACRRAARFTTSPDEAVLAVPARRRRGRRRAPRRSFTPTRNRGQSSCSSAMRRADRWRSRRRARRSRGRCVAILSKTTMSSSPTIWCTSPPARSRSGMRRSK